MQSRAEKNSRVRQGGGREDMLMLIPMQTLTSGTAWGGMEIKGKGKGRNDGNDAWRDEWLKGGSTVPSHTVYAKKDQKE